MTPIKVLRNFLEQKKELRDSSTQFGLAQLVGRSESMIRAVESGRFPMSRKLAKLLSAITGASVEWLMLDDVDGKEIPSTEGGPLKHSDVLTRIHKEISMNLAKVHPKLDPADSTYRQLAQAVAKLVEDEIFACLNNGVKLPSGANPITEILEWVEGLQEQRKAAATTQEAQSGKRSRE